MEPEEIDKLFKDRLAGLPAMPSADAWSRLQQKMEPPKKEKAVWMYYVAASISLLLIIGVLFFRNQAPTNSGVELAIQKPIIKNNKENLPVQATEQLASTSTYKTEINKPGNKPKEQVRNRKAVKMTIEKPVLVASGTNIRKDKPGVNQASESEKPNTSHTNEATQVAEEFPKTIVPENTALALALAKTKPEAKSEMVQVLVKRDNLDEMDAFAEEDNLKENLARKGALLKNIYKQARNLKNGEPVELATLGVNTERIQSESKSIKEKFNKVISF